MKEHNEDRERGGREEGNNNVVVARCSFPLFFVLPFPPRSKGRVQKIYRNLGEESMSTIAPPPPCLLCVCKTNTNQTATTLTS